MKNPRAILFLAIAVILAIIAFSTGDWLLMGPGVAITAIIGIVMLFVKEPVKKEKVIKAEDTYKRKTIEL